MGFQLGQKVEKLRLGQVMSRSESDIKHFFRGPASLVKPLKESATDEEKAAREVKLAENKPKVFCYLSNITLESTLNLSHFQASRILVLVRHGQYNLDGTQDSERFFAFAIFINMFIETSSRANEFTGT